VFRLALVSLFTLSIQAVSSPGGYIHQRLGRLFSLFHQRPRCRLLKLRLSRASEALVSRQETDLIDVVNKRFAGLAVQIESIRTVLCNGPTKGRSCEAVIVCDAACLLILARRSKASREHQLPSLARSRREGYSAVSSTHLTQDLHHPDTIVFASPLRAARNEHAGCTTQPSSSFCSTARICSSSSTLKGLRPT
jgi:hypothetical protein